MKLREKFPRTEEQSKEFDVVFRDANGVFKIFEIEDSTTLTALDKAIQNVNCFLDKNGFDEISAIEFIKNDFSYKSQNKAVHLEPHGYSSNKLVLHIERENYINLASETIIFIKSFFYNLKLKTVGYEPGRYLHEVIDEAGLLPKRPHKNCFVSFEYNHSTFSIAFSDYKIEFDCYVGDFETDENGKKYNFESYKSHYYYFGFDGTTETEGDFDQYREELFQALDNVKLTDISISDKE